MLRKVPLIVILGSTGTGKTKLSIELAQHFNGEIISADSMQVYANLDIATAKATKEEQSKVPHHLLDVAIPSEPFTVLNFRNTAMPIINNLLEKSKCPILVGGTNYYIESLLWDILVNSQVSEIRTAPTNKTGHMCLKEDLPSEVLHNYLRKIDATTAERIHPRNKRKIVRALEVYNQTGVPLSTILNEQRNKPGGNRLGGPLRYPHTILFWLKCDQEILNDRLNKRIDSMIEQGLLRELREFYNINLKSTCDNQYTKGIYQTIGFKEFIPYLKQFDSRHDRIINDFLQTFSNIIPVKAIANEPEGLRVLQGCLDELKLVTQRYSKKQIKWIKNRFLSSKGRQVPPLYNLDTTDISQWNLNVNIPAIKIIESYINEKKCKYNPAETLQHLNNDLNEEITNYCEICKRHFIGEFQWRLHLKSNKHKKRKDGINKKLKNNKITILSNIK